MTRDEHRAMCIDAMAKARWRLNCMESVEEYRRAGWTPPERWADPWHESGSGLHQQKKYIRDAAFIFDALHGIARVDPIEATNEMLLEGACVLGQEAGFIDAMSCWNAMSTAGDLTNPPENKPS